MMKLYCIGLYCCMSILYNNKPFSAQYTYDFFLYHPVPGNNLHLKRSNASPFYREYYCNDTPRLMLKYMTSFINYSWLGYKNATTTTTTTTPPPLPQPHPSLQNDSTVNANMTAECHDTFLYYVVAMPTCPITKTMVCRT